MITLSRNMSIALGLFSGGLALGIHFLANANDRLDYLAGFLAGISISLLIGVFVRKNA